MDLIVWIPSLSSNSSVCCSSHPLFPQPSSPPPPVNVMQRMRQLSGNAKPSKQSTECQNGISFCSRSLHACLRTSRCSRAILTSKFALANEANRLPVHSTQCTVSADSVLLFSSSAQVLSFGSLSWPYYNSISSSY